MEYNNPKIILIKNETDFYYWFFGMSMKEILQQGLGYGDSYCYKIFLADMLAGRKWYRQVFKKGEWVQFIDASKKLEATYGV